MLFYGHHVIFYVAYANMGKCACSTILRSLGEKGRGMPVWGGCAVFWVVYILEETARCEQVRVCQH